jgi:hypothetical protein
MAFIGLIQDAIKESNAHDIAFKLLLPGTRRKESKRNQPARRMQK